MIKVFGHYFHRRTVLQVVTEAILIGLVSACSLWLQRGPTAQTSDVMAEAVFMGALVALAFAGVNGALGAVRVQPHIRQGGDAHPRRAGVGGVVLSWPSCWWCCCRLDEGYNLVATFAMLADHHVAGHDLARTVGRDPAALR
jgi:hypothetical protein